jgi:hypothetical protein
MRRELLLLREMRDAAVAILDLVGGRSAEQLEADTVRRSALLWHFTVLGEAASQIPTETKDAHPKSLGVPPADCATALFTATGPSMSKPLSQRQPTTSR